MILTSGTRIGAYEVGDLIGRGGMGEVFRARDLALGRSVAVKVLPSSIATDQERLARFEREAQTLASLNHPNIAQVFGFEKGNVSALIMELVEGPTLADRIAAGPIPLDEALPIAVQIAEALECAHDLGIIHRDLKPANVKVRPDGMVKVLDFGLAKATHLHSDAPSESLLNSPTITSPAMTAAGTILGTASYMSPEQAKGRIVDRRADIWAFGCVLFEMLSGKRAFSGDDVSDVLVSILRDEPAWSTLPANTPPHVRSLLRRCLEKGLRARLPHIGVARLELGAPLTPADMAPPAGARRTMWPVAAAVAIAIAIAVGVSSWIAWSRRGSAPATPVRVRIDLGTENPIALSGWTAISPDGKVLVFAASRPTDSTASVLYVRHLDRLDAQLLPGTEGAQAPFFSPDGRWVAFFADQTLKKVPISGGQVISICAAPAARGGSWGDDDAIVFALPTGLSRVVASGGTAEMVVPSVPGQAPPTTPQVLPGAQGVIYARSITVDPAAGEILVHDFERGETKELLRGGRFPRYTTTGHLTFVRSGTLFAVPFDLNSLETRGEAVPVLEGVFMQPLAARPNLAIAADGTLVYQPGTALIARQSPVVWLTQTGALSPLRTTAAAFSFPRFSPDGRRLAMAISDGRQSDIWVYDWQRDILTRITSEPTIEASPVWTPDGTGLVFSSSRDSNVANLFWRRADGTGAEQRLTTSDLPQMANSIDPSGRLLVLHEGDPATARQNLTIVPLERDGTAVKAGPPRVLIGGPFLKANARISPDGKWMAYAANDTGTYEIYVQPFPGLGERMQVSAGGGNLAVWSPITNELYYAGPGRGRLMVVPYTTNGGAFAPAKPQQWSETLFSATPPVATYGPGFDIHPDGKRFAVTPAVEPVANAANNAQLVVVLNFFEELRRLVPFR